jgi:hypothetical protein
MAPRPKARRCLEWGRRTSSLEQIARVPVTWIFHPHEIARIAEYTLAQVHRLVNAASYDGLSGFARYRARPFHIPLAPGAAAGVRHGRHRPRLTRLASAKICCAANFISGTGSGAHREPRDKSAPLLGACAGSGNQHSPPRSDSVIGVTGSLRFSLADGKEIGSGTH